MVHGGGCFGFESAVLVHVFSTVALAHEPADSVLNASQEVVAAASMLDRVLSLNMAVAAPFYAPIIRGLWAQSSTLLAASGGGS